MSISLPNFFFPLWLWVWGGEGVEGWGWPRWGGVNRGVGDRDGGADVYVWVGGLGSWLLVRFWGRRRLGGRGRGRDMGRRRGRGRGKGKGRGRGRCEMSFRGRRVIDDGGNGKRREEKDREEIDRDNRRDRERSSNEEGR